MPVIIYTLGYRQKNAEEELVRLVAEGYRLVDIRRQAGSRYKADYNRLRLVYRFGGSYHRLRELGNEHYQNPSLPFVLNDQELGLQKAQRIIEEYTAGKGIILLCACAMWQSCHRSYVADLLLDRLPGARVIHMQEDGSTVVVESEDVQVHEQAQTTSLG
jgi:uncharacterized protein (DUF488 family)